jgi:uncharacterized sodium:solute symporter family permease YidK
MNTRLVMAASALVMGALGLSATFLPQEIAQYLSASNVAMLPLLIQIVGALYFAFAMLNWMAKDSLLGGIYNRPVAIGNLVHFVVGALALAKGAFANPTAVLIVAAAIYAVFAVAFGMILFTSPVRPVADL